MTQLPAVTVQEVAQKIANGDSFFLLDVREMKEIDMVSMPAEFLEMRCLKSKHSVMARSRPRSKMKKRLTSLCCATTAAGAQWRPAGSSPKATQTPKT